MTTLGVSSSPLASEITPVLTRDGRLIASTSAAVDPSEADRLDAVGNELKKAVATLGPKYGLQAS